MFATYCAPVITRYSLDDMEYALRVGLTSVLGHRPTDECLAVAMAKCRGETANGNAVWGHNLGNIKASETYRGNFTCITLNEVEMRNGKQRVIWYDPAGELVGGRGSALLHAPLEVPDGDPSTRMIVRANVIDAGYTYIDFIFSKPRYAKARDAMLAGNPQAYAHELKMAGYYTAPEDAYTKLVMALYTPSLAFVKKQHADQPTVIEKTEWHNQIIMNAVTDLEYERIRNDPGFGGASAQREWDRATEDEDTKPDNKV